jgi:hypothetical protein
MSEVTPEYLERLRDEAAKLKESFRSRMRCAISESETAFADLARIGRELGEAQAENVTLSTERSALQDALTAALAEIARKALEKTEHGK